MIVYLLGVALFVFLWAVVGHGIWLLIIGVIRGIFGKRCPACQRKYLGENCKCAQSMLHIAANQSEYSARQIPSVTQDIEAASRLIALTRFKRWLSDEQIVSLEQFIQSLRTLASESSNNASTIAKLPNSAIADKPSPPLDSAAAVAAAPEIQAVTQAVAVAPVVDLALPTPPRVEDLNQAASSRPAVHALDREYAAAETRPAQAPMQQRLTAGLLKSFMEQSNIRWVELISAALIVICSVGLVISLWSTLSSTSRFFPSLVFLLATVAVHGAGQYTLRQWKLRATSRGILHIGLMLIPLAVLVGILLSRRQDGLPQLDMFTVAIVACGTLVYGALAITASRSLFAGRWLIPAAVTIISGLTLLPIHFFGERQLLQQGSTTWALVPLVIVSMWSAFAMTRSNAASTMGLRIGSKRRIAGIVTQSLFALLVPIVFWALQLRSGGGVGPWWWVASGIVAATWSAWGWSASVLGPGVFKSKHGFSGSSSRLDKQRIGNSWFSIAAWLIASVCSVSLMAAIWQTGDNRITLSVILFCAAIWWLVHGWHFQLRIGLIAGGIALLTATTLVVETPVLDSTLNQATDWIGFKRISIMTAIGMVAAVATTVALALTPVASPAVRPIRRHDRASLALVLQQLQISGGIVIVTAAMLTLIASLVPIGETPYGGNWAALLLITYGVLAMGAGIGACRILGASLLSRSLLPIGQAILLLGAVRLCQTSPLLDELLSSLRPARAWAIGASLLAVAWSILAAVLSHKTTRVLSSELKNLPDPSQQSNIDWLCSLSTILAMCSAVAFWSNPDQLRLAGFLGWFLPLTCMAVFIAWRQMHWREISLLTLSLWTCSLVYAIGHANTWWLDIGLACLVSILVATSVTTLAAFEQAITVLQRKWPTSTLNPVNPDNSQASMAPASASSWIAAAPHWASALLLVVGWSTLLLALLGPSIPHFAACLGSTFEPATLTFVFEAIGQSGLALVLLCGVALTAVSAWIGHKYQRTFLLDSIALLPVVVAIAVGAWCLPTYSLAAALWALAVTLIASELIQFISPTWETRSINAWQRCGMLGVKVAREYEWLALARGISVALLALGTLAIAASFMAGVLPAQVLAADSRWSSNIAVLAISLGPALLCGWSRWLFSIWNAEHPQSTAISGVFASMAGATLSAFALAGGPAWPHTMIVGLQSFALLSALAAWSAMAFIAVRNFLGLRRVLAGKIGTGELISKTLKGARWQRVEKSSWLVGVLSLSAVVALCLGAAYIVVAYPLERLPGFERLGGRAVSGAAMVTLLLYWFLHARRGASHFGMLATALGLLAPLGAAAYAHWIIEVPSRSFPAARDFEPWRMLIVLWLIALSIGLAVRIVSAVHGKVLSKLGEGAWIVLASVVGGLALVSTTQDPNSIWPLCELSVLALIIVLSSVAADQPWRGHVAAFAAAAGMSAWLSQANGLHLIWNVFWGPTWIGLVAITAKLIVERVFSTQPEADQARPLRWTVDQSVSLTVPLVSALMSFLWIAVESRFTAAAASIHWSILGLALACVILAIARLWELHPGKRGLAFYFSLVSFAMVLAALLGVFARLPLTHLWLIWMASGLGAMAVIAGLLREMVREASSLGPTLKFGSITEPAKLRHALHWMPTLHTTIALLALVPSILLVMSFEERTMRVAATILPIIGALSILPIASERRTNLYRYVGLTLISTSLVLLFWADLPVAWTVVGASGAWIFVHRAFLAFVLLGVLYPMVVYGLLRKQDWVKPLMNSGWIAFAIGVTLGCVMLAGEATTVWKTAAVEAALATKLMTIVAWAAVTARLLQFAAQPLSSDRLASDQTRMLAVYCAEFSLAFLCGSCYFHFPDLFGGVFVKWWPIVVFAIAMLSAGVGEWLRRIDQHIIASPLGRSSLLLPIIPLTGVWWFRPEQAEWLWHDWGRYSFLLLSAAMLYGLHSWLRNSIHLRALASVLTLFSFWAFLQSNPSLQFIEHPQFWILPPALAVLCFVEFNRSRLAPSVVVAARYLAIIIAYLSSTAEVFFKAFEGQLWQPLLLLVLALAGAAAGIILRVRTFLYCGLVFTFVALLGMVWHAQQAIGQVWPWWAFGIATGVSLIVLLGYFEKNRPKVVDYLEKFKQWEQ